MIGISHGNDSQEHEDRQHTPTSCARKRSQEDEQCIEEVRKAKNAKHRWSHHVMETSDAMDIERDIFKTGSAEEIAQSLKHSSTSSTRRKGTPYQSAMSMLNFYINRAGRNLPKTRRNTLERAKKHLRDAFGRKP